MVNNYNPFATDHLAIVIGAVLAIFFLIIDPLSFFLSTNLRDCETISQIYKKSEIADDFKDMIKEGKIDMVLHSFRNQLYEENLLADDDDDMP